MVTVDYIEHIAKAVEFIEQNLADEIDLAACARACGYSQYHFRVSPENVTIQDFSLTVYKCLGDDPPICWNKYNAKRLSSFIGRKNLRRLWRKQSE